MVSPRRSSRAHHSQASAAANSQLNSSSASSISSNRHDRSALSTQKASPRDSAAPQSHSSQSRDASSKPPPRRTRSSQEDTQTQAIPSAEEVEEDEGENDVTRCVCGCDVYPGSPFAKERAKERSASKGRDPALGPDCVFIQCDTCKVWQHGPCVGMPDDSDADSVEYFCEECRPELHKVSRNSSGQQYSRYLPIKDRHSFGTSPSPPNDEPKTKARDTRTSRIKTDSTAGKRRWTMNSRDAAYDEAEQLRIALEQSKNENTATAERKNKRSLEDSEERTELTKRRRTSNSSPSPRSSQTISRKASPSPGPNNSSDPKTIRGAAARNRAAKESREREAAREQERQEAATRRKARSERRRADDVAADEEGAPTPPIPTTAPQPSQPASTKAPPNSKGGRPPTRRRGRLGRNQYTKDRSSPTGGRFADETAGDHSGIDSRGGSPRVHSHHHHNHHHGANGETAVGGRTGAKHKTINPYRTSMTDLKRRVGAILDFITRAQVELANDNFATEFRASLPAAAANATSTSPTMMKKQQQQQQQPAAARKDNSAEKIATQGLVNGDDEKLANQQNGGEQSEEAEWEGFERLSGVEMMDILTTKLIRWQAEYGKLEK